MSAADTPTAPPTFGRTQVDADDLLQRGRPPAPGAPVVPPEDDLAPVAPASPLDALRAELATDVSVEEVTLDVPRRPGWAVRYRCDITGEERGAWITRATTKAAKGDKPAVIDELRLSGLALANKAIAIIHNGEEVTDDGRPVTFASQVLLDMVGAARAADVPRRLYGLDGHVIAAARTVFDKSGFGDDLPESDDDEDPTRTSR